ncbi:MAG: thermonuclease family protein [Parvibaculaceae bacterium]
MRYMRASYPCSLLSRLSLAVLLSLALASAADANCKLKKSEPVEISMVGVDGLLTLTDGRMLRLAALARPDSVVAVAGWSAVVGQVAPARFNLYQTDKPNDRYGVLQGVLARADGSLVEEELVRQGLARVSPRADMRLCLSDLLHVEAEARANRRGLWAEPANQPLAATDIAALEAREGQFVLVEGVVTDAIIRGGRLYLNFDADWRTDFTVTVAAGDARLFRDQRLKAKTGARPAMKGARVRVRGVLMRYNGPEMILTTPEQLEFLELADMPAPKAAEGR